MFHNVEKGFPCFCVCCVVGRLRVFALQAVALCMCKLGWLWIGLLVTCCTVHNPAPRCQDCYSRGAKTIFTKNGAGCVNELSVAVAVYLLCSVHFYFCVLVVSFVKTERRDVVIITKRRVARCFSKAHPPLKPVASSTSCWNLHLEP